MHAEMYYRTGEMMSTAHLHKPAFVAGRTGGGAAAPPACLVYSTVRTEGAARTLSPCKTGGHNQSFCNGTGQEHHAVMEDPR